MVLAMPSMPKAINLFGLENNPNKASDVFQGDIKFKPGDIRFKESSHGRGLIQSSNFYRWPNGVVAYKIDPTVTYSASQIQLIHDAMALINQKTNGCISFVERTTQSDYIIIRQASGCSSYVGKIGGAQYLTLQHTSTGSCLYKGTIVHELCHAIGQWHEQSRPDRDNYVTVNYENIISGYEYNFNTQSGGYFGTSYNQLSTMHYDNYAFSSNGRPTIVGTVPLIHSAYKSDAELLVAEDVNSIKAAYGCPIDPSVTYTTTIAPVVIKTTTVQQRGKGGSGGGGGKNKGK